MYELKVANLVGDRCVTSEDGQKVYDEIVPKLRSNEKICLDFEGTTIFASPFFNLAVGQLLKDFSSDKLNELLEILNLGPNGILALKRVIKNSKKYFQDPKIKDALDTTIEEEAEDK